MSLINKISAAFTAIICFFSLALSAQVNANQASAPKVSLITELKAFTHISELPLYRDGTMLFQTSSYDRTGWNDDGFSGRYSFVRRNGDSSLVLFDAKGPGVINRIWTPTPTTDTLDFFIDDTIRPRFTISYMDLFSGKIFPFVAPLCNNQLGGYYCYLPIPFQKRCIIVFRGKQTQFYQVGYRAYPQNTTVKPFDNQLTAEERKAVQAIGTFWEKETEGSKFFTHHPNPGSPAITSEFQLRPGEQKNIFKINKGGRITGFEIAPSFAFEGLSKDVDIRITWDNESRPAVYCPVSDFFGYAFGRISMQSLLIGSTDGKAYCYFPMPFDKSASIELIYRKTPGGNTNPLTLRTKVFYQPKPRHTTDEGKFYAFWNHQAHVPMGKPHVMLQISGKGHYVGTALQTRGLEPGMTGFFEGDDSTVVDGILTMHGTGSEDYFNGGWYAMMDRWDGPLSLPLSGALDYNLPLSRTGGYRLFLSDKIPFSKSIHHSMEHGPEHNRAPGSYTSVAYYYSEDPPPNAVSPTAVDTKVSMPDTMMVYPQLLTINTFGDLTIKRRWAYHTGGEAVIFAAPGEAAVRIRLDEVPDGNYKVFLDYARHPEGSFFSLWQRQTPLSDWKPSRAMDTARIEYEFMSDVLLTPLNHTLTLRFKPDGSSNQFFLNRLILVRKEP